MKTKIVKDREKQRVYAIIADDLVMELPLGWDDKYKIIPSYRGCIIASWNFPLNYIGIVEIDALKKEIVSELFDHPDESFNWDGDVAEEILNHFGV